MLKSKIFKIMNKSLKKIITFLIINFVIDTLDSNAQKNNVLTFDGIDYPLTVV